MALTCRRWLLLAKLEQHNSNLDSFVSAQEQALKLQQTLLDQLRDSGGVVAAGSVGSSTAPTSRGRGKSGVGSDMLAGFSGGLAAIGTLSSAKAKAADICFQMAEFFRKHRQFDKVGAWVLVMHRVGNTYEGLLVSQFAS